jgi:hypothetical protein
MSFRPFSSPASEADARQPLLSETGRTPATVSRLASVARANSPLGFFSSPSPVPVPRPLDTRGFDTFDVAFNSAAIPLNVLDETLVDIEREIVNQFIITRSTDPSVIYGRLKLLFESLYRDKSEKELKRLIVRVLDEIILYGEGCSQFQINTLKQKLTRLEQETAFLASEEAKVKMTDKLVAWGKKKTETKEEQMEREAKEAKIEKRKQERENETDLLQRRIPYCENRRQQLMANSLLSKFNANDARECAFVRFCHATYRGENEFCGRATIEYDDTTMSSGIINIPVPDKIKFELVITGDGSNSDTTSVRLTRFCKFASLDSEEYLPFVQAYQGEESRARKIEEDVKNALFNQFKDQLRGTLVPDVETNGVLVTAFGPKRCATVGQNDRLLEDPDQNSCCSPCSLQGGAKKIKRARQSKKKKARRSKLKSKRVRRKNKSRRN